MLEGRRAPGRPTRKWKDNIKTDFREIYVISGDMDWIHLAQDRDKWRVLVATVINFRVS
jgi:hypothetical protein